MNVAELRKLITLLNHARRTSPGVEFIQFAAGKARYSGRGCFTEVGNKLTAEMPEFYLPVSDADTLEKWLIPLYAGDIAIDVNKTEIKFKTPYSVLRFARRDLYGADTYYNNVDEIVRLPLLTHKNGMTLWRGHYDEIRHSLSALSPDLLMVSADADREYFAVNTQKGIAKVFLQTSERNPIPGWRGTFIFEGLNICPGDDSYQSVHLSYTHNDSKQLSPLVIRYEGGVTVALAPLWK